jgi:uncharacterized membrane protein YbhN (UPF0104 family)
VTTNGERPPKAWKAASRRNWKRALVVAAGIVLGAVFLWLATRHIDPHETEKALREMDLKWLAAGVGSYLAAIALRCLRWGYSGARDG